ncbi:hypothetical protein Tco_0546622 [Tanacetum coccineum]
MVSGVSQMLFCGSAANRIGCAVLNTLFRYSGVSVGGGVVSNRLGLAWLKQTPSPVYLNGSFHDCLLSNGIWRLWWLIKWELSSSQLLFAGRASMNAEAGTAGGMKLSSIMTRLSHIDPTIVLGSRAEGSPFEPSLCDPMLVSESPLYVGIRVHKAEHEQIKHLEITTRAYVGFISNVR